MKNDEPTIEGKFREMKNQLINPIHNLPKEERFQLKLFLFTQERSKQQLLQIICKNRCFNGYSLSEDQPVAIITSAVKGGTIFN